MGSPFRRIAFTLFGIANLGLGGYLAVEAVRAIFRADGMMGAVGGALLLLASIPVALTGAPAFLLSRRTTPDRVWLIGAMALTVAALPWAVVAWLVSL